MEENNKKLKFIAIYEMIGGFLGCIVSIFLLVKIILNVLVNQDILFINKILVIFIFLYAFTAYIFIFISGLNLMKKKKNGVLFSIISQIIQIPNVIIFGSSYLFISGLELSPGLIFLADDIRINFQFYLGSSFNINFNNLDKDILSVGVNIIPILILFYLIKVYKSNKNNSEN